MNEPAIKCCCNCRYWYLQNGDMYCRRRAPTRDLMCHPMWPNTMPLQWCGDWEAEMRDEVERRKFLLKPNPQIKEFDGVEIEP